MASSGNGRVGGLTAIVTGAMGRLGGIWCEALAREGARVVAIDLASTPTSSAIVALAERFAGRVHVIGADVRSRAELMEAVARLPAHGDGLVLVNNAGIDQPPGNVVTHRLTEWPLSAARDVLEVNTLGAMNCMQVFGDVMVGQGRGSIINIGSLYASVSPDPRLYDHLPTDPPFLKPPAYGASKGALVNLTRYFAVHWAPLGVRVNALSPGGVRGGQDPEFVRKFESRVPMGRMADPDDLVGPLLFLASDDSRYVTGIELVVDGGYSAW